MQKTVEEIRALLDPEGYETDMKEIKEQLIRSRGRLFVNLDLNHDDPKLKGDVKRATIEETEGQILQVQWRIERVEQRIKGMMKAASPPRAERRRKKKTAK